MVPSYHKCFVKVPQPHNVSGTPNYWTLDLDQFIDVCWWHKDERKDKAEDLQEAADDNLLGLQRQSPSIYLRPPPPLDMPPFDYSALIAGSYRHPLMLHGPIVSDHVHPHSAATG